MINESQFYNNIYLPEINKMAKPTTDNKVHREFASNQIKKLGQYYTEEKQISMKLEAFYDKPVEELWAWWEDKNKQLLEFKDNLSDDDKIKDKDYLNDYSFDCKKITTDNAMMKFPIDTITSGESILDVIKITFINGLSRLINSYIKYGKKTKIVGIDNKPEDYQKSYEYELNYLAYLLVSLDDLFFDSLKTGRTYGKMYQSIIDYFEWFNIRNEDFEKEGKGKPVPTSINDVCKKFNYMSNANFFIIPASMGLNYYKTIKLYSIPVVIPSIVNTIGHDAFMNPETNFNHDFTHMIGLKYMKLDDFLPFKNFYIAYEQINNSKHTDINYTKDELKYLNYILFSIMHESGSAVVYLKVFNELKNNVKYDIFIKHNNIFSSFSTPNYIYQIIILTYMFMYPDGKLGGNSYIDSNIFTQKIYDYAENKKTLINPDNKENFEPVIKDGDTYKIIGNPIHVDYVDVELFKKIFRDLYKLFTDLGYYNEEKFPKIKKITNAMTRNK
jgi:hypothetical protein